MVDLVVALSDEQDVPRSKLVMLHCDLRRVEWPGVSELAKAHAQHYGLRFLTVSRPQGDLLSHIEQRGMFPDATRRYCTSQHKRSQGLKTMTRLVEEINARRLLTWRTPLKRLQYMTQTQALGLPGMGRG